MALIFLSILWIVDVRQPCCISFRLIMYMRTINRDVHTYTWFTDFKSLYANRLNGNFPTRPLKFIRFFNLSGKYSIYHQKWNSSYLSRHYFSTTVYSKKFNTHKTSHTYLTQARKSISPTTRAYRVVC